MPFSASDPTQGDQMELSTGSYCRADAAAAAAVAAPVAPVAAAEALIVAAPAAAPIAAVPSETLPDDVTFAAATIASLLMEKLQP